ncbi:hypothetical protein [Synechococcus sp. MIT S1220]|uniref:hypothetical protein n=1 Tax=Synechococcus sp. MIT S1220 TaxID=3082549 RepID=UPI0039AF06E5
MEAIAGEAPSKSDPLKSPAIPEFGSHNHHCPPKPCLLLSGNAGIWRQIIRLRQAIHLETRHLKD